MVNTFCLACLSVGASVFGQLWRLLNDESSCTALFHFGKQDREDLVTFFMQGQEVPPSTMVIRKKLEGIVGKFQRGEPAAVHAHGVLLVMNFP